MNETDPTTPPAPPTEAGELSRAAQPDYSGIRIPILISGIFNILAGLAWVSTCLLSPLAIPLLVLAVFEIIAFVKLGDPAQAQATARRVKTLGILEICTILLGNLASLVCGIIVLINAKE
jgi:hypothetical protein